MGLFNTKKSDATGAPTGMRGVVRALLGQLRLARHGYKQEPGIARYLDVDKLHQAIINAEVGNVWELFTIMRDMVGGHGHVTACYNQRKLSVLSEGWFLEPSDRKNEASVRACDMVRDMMEDKGDMFNTAFAHLLGGALWPCAVVEKVFGVSARDGLNYEIEALNIIPPVAFDYSMDAGRKLRLKTADAEGNIIAGETIEPDDFHFVVHRPTLMTEVPEYHGGLLRSVLFWWLFSTFSRDWWSRFLNRYGSPFLVATYEKTDPEGRFMIEDAMQWAQQTFGVAIPEGTSLQIQQAQSQSGGSAFDAFHAVANGEISKIILGQTLSSQAQNIGFGGGQASVQNEVRREIVAYDAMRLAMTVRQKILIPLFKMNGLDVGLVPSLRFAAVRKDDLLMLGELLAKLATAGLQPSDDSLEDLSLKLGISLERKPEPMQTQLFAADDVAKNAVKEKPIEAPVASPKKKSWVLLRKKSADEAREATDALAGIAATDLAKALGKHGDVVARIIMNSKSRAEALSKLNDLEIEADADVVIALFEAMQSGAANGIASTIL